MTRLASAAVLIASGTLAGCQTPVGDVIMGKVADAVARYCAADESTRAAVRANLEPYLADGVGIEITCPGDRR